MKAAHKQPPASSWESERAQLIAERDQLTQLLADTEGAAALALERQIATAVERVRAELTTENRRLREELANSQDAAKDWATERARLQLENERTAQMLSGSEEAAAIALDRQISTAVARSQKDLTAQLAKQKDEHKRALAEMEENRSSKFHKEMTAVVASVRGELEAEAKKLRHEIDKLKSERDQAKADLTDLQNEQAHSRRQAEEAAALTASTQAELIAERDHLKEELESAERLATEYRALAEERETTNKLLAETADKQNNSASDMQKVAAETLEREVAAVRRNMQEQTKAEVERARSELKTELSKLSEKHAAALDEVNRIQTELEQQLSLAKESEQQRLHLQEQLDKSTAALASPAAQAPPNGHPDMRLIHEEVTRVEASIQAIMKAIDDPNAELSVVVRKNVERAQLDSYLEGLRFIAGNS